MESGRIEEVDVAVIGEHWSGDLRPRVSRSDACTAEVSRAKLEVREGVKVYAKLPGWFTIPTPLGSYNPAWAVLVDTDEGERLYFVVETKSSLFEDDLRDTEWAKIKCGKAHFAALAGTTESPAEFVTATTLNDVLV